MYFYRKKHIYVGGPLVVHASHSRWEFSEPICISVPGGVVRGCVQLWWIFFENFQRVCPFHYGWFISTPALLSVQQFMTQNVITPLTPPFQSPDPAPSDFFSCCFPGWEKKKSPQRETLCRCGKCETKNNRSVKRHHNWQVQKTVLSSRRNIASSSVLHQLEHTLKVTEF